MNVLEDKIFQKEGLLKDWLQKSSVVSRIHQNSKEQKQLINDEALKYQDKVITKHDLMKGHHTSSRNRLPINKVKKSIPIGKKEVAKPLKKAQPFDASKEIPLRIPEPGNSRNSSKRLLSQRSPATKNLSLQVHNL